MKLAEECRSCLLTKAVQQAGYVTDNQKVIQNMLDACTREYDRLSESPIATPIVSGAIHRTCYKAINSIDPYVSIKKHDNMVADELVKGLGPQLNSLHDFLVAAVIGNSLDYGVTGHDVASDFAVFFQKKFKGGLAIDDSEQIFSLAKRVVYFTDNCGEAVFDRLFCQELKKRGAHITIVVKDGPMLNDVTMKEAKEIGLDNVCDQILSAGGGSQIGLHPQYYPQETKDAIANATLLISKGLGNYESLTEEHQPCPVAYLLMVKCEPVARHVGAKKGDMIAVLR